MKLRDFVFLLLLFNLPFYCLAALYQDCNYWKDNRIAESNLWFSVSLRILDSLTSAIPLAPSNILWIALDLSQQDAVDYKTIENCHINQHIRSRLLSNLLLRAQSRSGTHL